MNMELIYSKNPNVIYYDSDIIQFHGIKKTDGNANIIGEDSKPASVIAIALESVKANVGKTFTIIPPQIIKLGKDLNFEENKILGFGGPGLKTHVLKEHSCPAPVLEGKGRIILHL